MALVKPSDFECSPEFWKKFKSENWNGKPFVFKRLFNGPILSSTEALQCLTHALSYKKGDARPVIFLNAGLYSVTPQTNQPIPDDKNLSDFITRVSSIHDQRIGLNVKDLQMFMSWNIIDRFRYFVKGFYTHIGLPLGRVECEIFCGNYINTPAGVHQDKANVFFFVIEGSKNIRVWPDTIFDKPPINYEKFIGSSVLLEGEPGDVLYWPSSYWHVAESSGEPSASISLALLDDQENAASLIIPDVSTGLATLKKKGQFTRLPFSNSLPRVIKREQAKMKKTLRECITELELAVELSWAKKVTAYGFDKPSIIIPHSSKLKSSDILRVNPDFPIVFKRIGDKLLLAFNGQGEYYSFDSKLVQIIKTLNTGKATSISDLYGGKDKSEVYRLVETMIEHSAIQVNQP